jgi:hypothetical protein
MAPLIVAPETTPNSLALGIGTTLLVSAALTKMTASLAALVDAGVSWQQAVRCSTPCGVPSPRATSTSQPPRFRRRVSHRGARSSRRMTCRSGSTIVSSRC